MSSSKVSSRSSYTEAEVKALKEYTPKNTVRMLTATALFDGHDASINIIRRLLQLRGAEVIHLGHNRSAEEIVNAALEEDVTALSLSSYQGGHMEFFKYIRELLDKKGRKEIKIFGGGGGVISPSEIKELEGSGVVEKIYSPEDGQILGLDGIIGDILKRADQKFGPEIRDSSQLLQHARICTLLENGVSDFSFLKNLSKVVKNKKNLVVGLTGTGGAGKSSLLDEILLRFLHDFKEIKIAVFCVDPTKKTTGGALLGDRIRINSCFDDRIFLRSFASRQSGKELAQTTKQVVEVFREFDYDLIFVETSGIGQGDSEIKNLSDISLYVMTPEYGAQTQLEKIDMLDLADFIVVNKYERAQGEDAVRDVRQAVRRSRFKGAHLKDSEYPVFGTIASRFNDDGTNGLYRALVKKIGETLPKFKEETLDNRNYSVVSSNRNSLIPALRAGHLHEISKTVRDYHKKTEHYEESGRLFDAFEVLLSEKNLIREIDKKIIEQRKENLFNSFDPELRESLKNWEKTKSSYFQKDFSYVVRGKEVKIDSSFTSLAQQTFPRVTPPYFKDSANLIQFFRKENLPGNFPYTAGIFPFRRRTEEAKRQFAGEGGPGQTNRRFHFLCKDDDAKRLSTAFDSVTLYGAEPHERPDIFGKVGESGVSVAHLDDMKELYKGFDLCSPSTSVSMTINGPAPIILALFLNTAISQQLDQFREKEKRDPTEKELTKIREYTLQTVRGTVQADILKEDQAQNTCIFSIEFALKLMGDVQEFFVQKKMENYYAVSISGYHIAEAGANPITQLAFTLANGFAYVEYYLSRGLLVDSFAPNLSFFFSNGLDVEYTVLGRVARRIWAIAMKYYYTGNSKSQKLKYHVQTSGRSLHAQEMDFNDIRTTLQALLALSDNCNSLHTNAYDEALTTPTEESVRRAMAIQKIINKEFGAQNSENLLQGSFFLEYLTDRVEEAVLLEFDSLARRGGVLAAMEMQYQRSKIQEESLYYEYLKDSGELPIIGVNTFLNQEGNTKEIATQPLTRASYEDKKEQIRRKENFQMRNKSKKEEALRKLKNAVIGEKNIFEELMDTVCVCSLGEITQALYEVGGRYRRSM